MSQRRVIVAQPASLCREGAGLLQTGVLRWDFPPRSVEVEGTKLTLAPLPVMTFIVKATFSYARCSSMADEMTLADEPEGLALDVPSELPGAAEDEIAYSSDFIPRKRMRDLLLTGYSFARRPTDLLRAGIALGPVSRAFVVEGAKASVRAPLIRSAIRSNDGKSAAEPVGPSLTPPLLEEFPFGFDFIAYNTAPPSQQLEFIQRGAKLSLFGLSDRAETLELKLPDVEPVLWIDTMEDRGIPISLECDTVWIDTDRELVVMVYRGLTEVPSLEFDGIAQATLAFARGGVSPSFEDVQKDLERGAFEAAVELTDFDDEAGPSPEASMFAKYEVWEKPIEPTISLEKYAQISAALAEEREPRDETLKAYGFNEESFLLEERGWLTTMSEAAMKGDSEPATRYSELFVNAQDALAGPNEGRETVDEYVALKVELDEAADPMKPLADRQMKLAQWMRMDRRWTRRALADQALEAEIDRREAAYRMARLGEGEQSINHEG
ncbi:MAG: DUF2169 domain-containing protein [Polyangiaceae bacterium]|nr:DUF2169 domain-containing protein [Polyangiaceae bacterium]